jgi:alkane 1-monooxygenase
VNYIEHYGLSRKILKNGKYEFVQPHHSWNSTYKVSNWVLINLQRHSDHHFKPARSFPLLQNLGATKAPQLPHSYPAMGILALFPSAWMSIMNPRVSRWREMFYPEITDWKLQV